MRVPSHFRQRVKRVDPDLDVEWLEREGKFAIVQQLDNFPTCDTLTDRVLGEVLRRYAENGYTPDRAALGATLYAHVVKNRIVFRVENTDGSYRPLDDRTLGILERMAWKRRHRTVKDWLQAGDDMDYEAKRLRDRQEAGLFSAIERDSVFQRIVSDTAAGLKIQHSVHGRPERHVFGA